MNKIQRPATHYSSRSGWLRASVLGANDGIVSTASLLIGIVAANIAREDIILAGTAAIVAGAMSMAAGEYVSVCSQEDVEKADMAREKYELEHNYDYELQELATIYRKRGLEAELAKAVATQLMAHDALAAHARDELGFTEQLSARPLQAALSSALSFVCGALLPMLFVLLLPSHWMIIGVACSSLFALAILGCLAAKVGGSPVLPALRRILFWGVLAMMVTAVIGRLFASG